MNQQPNILNQIFGGQESHVVVGVAAYTIPAGLRGFALTCRVTGTIISAITVQYEHDQAPVAYVPTWLGIPLYAGDYFVSKWPIASITLTAAGDSVTLHCSKPY